MSIKHKRIDIYNKFGGKCAYCGKSITFKEMQVDHKFPKYLKHWLKSDEMMDGTGSEGLQDINHISNLMPSCRSCNYHKNTLRVEQFRKEIELKAERIKNSNVLLLERFGLVKFINEPVIFYFEINDEY